MITHSTSHRQRRRITALIGALMLAVHLVHGLVHHHVDLPEGWQGASQAPLAWRATVPQDRELGPPCPLCLSPFSGVSHLLPAGPQLVHWQGKSAAVPLARPYRPWLLAHRQAAARAPPAGTASV